MCIECMYIPIAFELLIGFENAKDIIGVALINSWDSTKLFMVPRVALPVWRHNLFCKKNYRSWATSAIYMDMARR